MLVISRRKGQRIAIGDDVELVITEIHKSSVRVGIVAPRDQTVLRGEVRDSILAANRQAAASKVEDTDALAESLTRDTPPIRVVHRLPLGRRHAEASDERRRPVPAPETPCSVTPRSDGEPNPGGPE